MTGGSVVETILVAERSRIWINVQDDGRKCALYVEDTSAARCVQYGDTVWWQGDYLYWTPRSREGARALLHDYRLKRVGSTGVRRPAIRSDYMLALGTSELTLPSGRAPNT